MGKASRKKWQSEEEPSTLRPGMPCPIVDPGRFEKAVRAAFQAASVLVEGGPALPRPSALVEGFGTIELNTDFTEIQMMVAFTSAFEPVSLEENMAGQWRMAGLLHVLRNVVRTKNYPEGLIIPDPCGTMMNENVLHAAALAPILVGGCFDQAELFRLARLDV